MESYTRFFLQKTNEWGQVLLAKKKVLPKSNRDTVVNSNICLYIKQLPVQCSRTFSPNPLS